MTTSVSEGEAPAASRSQALRLRRVLAVMLCGVVLYAGFAVAHGLREVRSSLSQFAWSGFVLACALALGNYLTRFLKWEFYLARLGIRGIPKLQSLLVFLSGMVFTVTPGKVGEVYKSLLLEQRYGVPLARTAPIVLAERLTDVLGIALLIVAGSVGLPGGLVWAGTGVAFVGVGLLVVRSERARAHVLLRLRNGPARLRDLAPKIEEAWASLYTMTALSALVVPTLLSVFAWALEGLALWVILHAFEQSTSTLVACFFYSVATLAGAIVPVPGGLGVTEGLLEGQLAHFGAVPSGVATSAMILTRIATLWFAVLVGFIALSELRRSAARKAPSPVACTASSLR